MNIIKCTSRNNTTAKSGRSLTYIVMHYTAGTSSASGAAKSVAEYFAKESTQASADFIVDDENIIQFNPDIENRYCWSVGGSKYSSMTTSEGGKYYGIATNANTINIEMCSSKTDKSSLSASDTDWYLTDKVVANAAELVKYLMETYEVNTDHVIMHHHVTGKLCPNPWCVSEARLEQWKSFKATALLQRCQLEAESEEDEEMVETIKMNINGTERSINRILKDGKNYICLADLSEMGFDVGYDSNTKTPSLDNTVKDIPIKIDGEEKTVKAINVGGFNFCKIRELTDVLGGLEIDYADGVVIINNVGKDS